MNKEHQYLWHYEHVPKSVKIKVDQAENDTHKKRGSELQTRKATISTQVTYFPAKYFS